MNNRVSEHALRRMHLLLLRMTLRLSVTYALWILANTCVCASAAEPGEKRILEITGENGGCQLEFAYVPAGPVTPFAREKGGSPQVLALPFYIMTTEASVKFFNDHAPPDVKKTHALRESENAGDLLMPDLDARRKKGADYPVLWVSPDEIAALTAIINAQLLAKKPSSSIVRESVRLATLAEWRHAMSAGSSPDSGLFNNWPTFTAFATKDQGMCRDVWSACGGSGEFQGTPEQVLWLVENPGSEAARCYEVATLFTQHLIKGREASGVQPWEKTVDPFDAHETLTAAEPNKFGIYGAHRNPCPEWVLGNDAQAGAIARWQKIEAGSVTPDEKKQKVLALIGPRFRLITREKLERFAELLIWAAPENVSLDDSEAKTIDHKAAFRLVLVESLADDWLGVVRPEILAAESVEKASAVAEARTRDVKRLSSESSPRHAAFIKAFFALRAYDAANTSLAVEALKPLLDTLTPSGKPKVDFAAMRRGETPTAQGRPTGDSIYLNTLVSLMKQDSSTSDQ